MSGGATVRWFPVAQTVDQSRCNPCAESIVNIDHGYSWCTGIEHGQQRGQSLEMGSVTDTGRDRNDGRCDQTAHHGWQCAFHSGHDHQYARPTEKAQAVEQTVQACHPDIVYPFDKGPHPFSRESGFLGNGNIRCAGRHDCYQSSWLGKGDKIAGDDSGGFMIDGCGKSSPHGLKLLAGGPRCKKVLIGLHECNGDGSQLFRGFGRGENNFRKPASPKPIQVQAGEPESVNCQTSLWLEPERPPMTSRRWPVWSKAAACR